MEGVFASSVNTRNQCSPNIRVLCSHKTGSCLRYNSLEHVSSSSFWYVFSVQLCLLETDHRHRFVPRGGIIHGLPGSFTLMQYNACASCYTMRRLSVVIRSVRQSTFVDSLTFARKKTVIGLPQQKANGAATMLKSSHGTVLS